MTTISGEPEQIRRDIERTQTSISAGVNAFADKVSPSRIVKNRLGRFRDSLGRTKDNVLGTIMGSDPGGSTHQAFAHLTDTASNVGDTASSAASNIADTASGAASSALDTASSAIDTASSAIDAAKQAPDIARDQARGNPIAAGVVPFGVGWLVSSLVPAGNREKQLRGELADQAADLTQPAVDAARQAAGEFRQGMAEPAGQAVDAVKATAADAGQSVGDRARSSAAEVGDQARDSVDAVLPRPGDPPR